MSHDPFEDSNRSTNPNLRDVLAAKLSRRTAIRRGIAAVTAAIAPPALTGCDTGDDDDDENAEAPPALGFESVPHSLADRVVVPAGYTARVLIATGDPIVDDADDYANDGTNDDFEVRYGDHPDGMAFFGLDDDDNFDPTVSDRGLLVCNHENISGTVEFMHPEGSQSDEEGNRPKVQVDKEMNSHGISVVEIRRDDDGAFEVVRDSSFNTRVTPFTTIAFHGPVAGSSHVVTPFDPDGETTRGTLNNCSNGVTPWGTYLSGEENWAGYWTRGADEDARTENENALLARYGIGPDSSGFAYRSWATIEGDDYVRFDVTATSDGDATDDYRNEPNGQGWVIELDPFDKRATVRKRTWLGRFAHEGAWVAPPVAGEPIVVYLGDDARNEYIYKFVSDEPWDEDDAGAGISAGDKYLDDGKLYVARFDADGTGRWIELSYGENGLDEDNDVFPFTSQADVLVAARLAADSVGATKMDRPEWGAVHPTNLDVYMTLTNSSSGSSGRGQGGPAPDAANPRSYDTDDDDETNGNVNGHIIRWREEDSRSASTSFEWDIYLFGSRSAYGSSINMSDLDDDNDFSSPDGLWFDTRGILWIQTDDGAYTDTTNCMMLAAIPGGVGDGDEVDVDDVTTYVGAAATGDTLRRFLVGPKGCEITGIDMTPDYRTMFVNIQHPGENTGDGFDIADPDTYESHWPAGGDARPRSATLVITKDDGGEIGT